MARHLIMVTNDDGIKSIGIKVLAEAVAPYGDLIVAAPTRQQSAMGRAFWSAGNESLVPAEFRVDGKPVSAYHCDCSPAWLVHHAILSVCRERRPDFLVSGVNLGSNLGMDLTLSATVGAAMQGAVLGIPSMAVSVQTNWFLPDHDPEGIPWDPVFSQTRSLFGKLVSGDFGESDLLLNVNYPFDLVEDTRWRFTRQADRPYFTSKLDSPSERSQLLDARISVEIAKGDVPPDSDIHAVLFDRQVSVTPLRLNLTA
jgi:5'-nucleotidase